MSALPQFRPRQKADSQARNTAAGSDDPLELLREAIAGLNASRGDVPDQAQLANLLTEAREALERASVIAKAAAQCEECLKQAQFEKAFDALDAALVTYPGEPALVARRRDVEKQQKAFHSAAAAQKAIEEAQWLLDQDRPDLAAQLLRAKALEFPDQAELIASLEELEAALPQWEQNRDVQAALARAGTLEQIQQWPAALTILEEALQSYPAAEALTAAAIRLRDRLADQERQKKLARRLELIGQKIAEQAWGQALTLVESTQKEFPDAPEWDPLRREVAAGLKRSECQTIVTEVRQCLADGEGEQADEILRKGLESFGQEASLVALRDELAAERKYREELRTAQLHFGRRQLQEAETVLTRLITRDRPEAQALLDAVRRARVASEEENLCEHGREKALKLMEQGQFAPAADLLRNLLSLFPGNSILERDLIAAQNGIRQESSPVVLMHSEPAAPPILAPPPAAPARAELPLPRELESAHGNPSRSRRLAVAGAASIALVAAGGAAWKLFYQSAPIAAPHAVQLTAGTPPAVAPESVKSSQASPPAVATPPVVAPEATEPNTVPSGKSKSQPKPSPPAPSRPFVPPAANHTPVQVQSSLLPLPAGTVAIISPITGSGIPADLERPINGPAPPPAQPPAAAPAPAQAPVVGGKAQEAQLVARTMPDYPALARKRGVSGAVQLEANVDEHGAVTNVRVLSGDAVLAAAAKTAVLKWKYKAATLNGQPIATKVAIQVLFGDRK